MAIIPEKFIESTTVIGVPIINGTKQSIKFIATGFFVGRYEGQNSKQEDVYSIYLITNKHVIKNLSSITVEYNSMSGNTIIQSIPLFNNNAPLFTGHSNPDVDIVAINFDLIPAINAGAKYSFFDLQSEVLSLQNMKSTGVCEGSFIYSVGFPVGIESELISPNTLKAPVCRMGCISKIEHLYQNINNDVCYLIDAISYPGNSGGPIISRPEFISIAGTPVNNDARLIGILNASLYYYDELESKQTRETLMLTKDNSGLTIVFPTDRILETVEDERLRKYGLAPNQKMQLP